MMKLAFILLAGLTTGYLLWALWGLDFRNVLKRTAKSKNPIDATPLSRPFVDAVAPYIRRMFPDLMQRIDRVIVLSGRPYGTARAHELIAHGIFVSLSALIVCSIALSVADVGAGTARFLLLAAAVLPFMSVVLQIYYGLKTRTKRLDHQFPYFLDFLVMMKEAGDNLPSALRLYVSSSPNLELSEAIGGVVRGMDSHKGGLHGAIQDFIDTCPSEVGRTTLTSILKAEEMGARSTAMLRDIARDLRAKRYEQAEKEAEALKSRSMFPMVIMFAGAFLMILAGSLGKMFSGLPG
jgi:Flp pilus assembly protein TadB